MAFKGTERRTAAEIAEAVENVGGHINAYTARENTAYYVKLLKEDLDLGADIIGDILTHSTFAPEELERERGVILQEIGQANDTPDDIVFDHFQETAYPGQPMGRPVLGTEAIIRKMKREALPGFMRTHYTPQNMVVAASGNLHHDQVVDLVARHFADLPAQKAAEAPMPADYTGGEFREDRELDQAHIVLGFSAPGYGEPDYYPSMLLSTLLGGGMSSRLFQEIREKRGLVYSIYSFTSPAKDGGLFGIYAGTGSRRTDARHPRRTRQGAKPHHPARTPARPRATESRAADVPRIHRQPMRADRPPMANLRPHHPRRGNGGENRGRDRRRHPRRCRQDLPHKANLGDDRADPAGAKADQHYRPPSGVRKEGKRFFFEKKKQKTFGPCGRWQRRGHSPQ
jgi:hypothetical protein